MQSFFLIVLQRFIELPYDYLALTSTSSRGFLSFIFMNIICAKKIFWLFLEGLLARLTALLAPETLALIIKLRKWPEKKLRNYNYKVNTYGNSILSKSVRKGYASGLASFLLWFRLHMILQRDHNEWK